MVNVVALARDLGIGEEEAAGILLVIFMAGFVGRVTFGALADRICGFHAYFAASALQTALVFFFTQVSSATGFYLLAIAFGFGFSGVMTSIVIIVREWFPLRRRGLTQGVVLFLAWIGMGLGGWQGGYFFDLSGGYVLPFANAALSGVVNLVLVGGFILMLSRRGVTTRPAFATA